MAYIRDPRNLNWWESDGELNKFGFRGSDGTLHNSGRDADRHDTERDQMPAAWKNETLETIDKKGLTKT